MNNKPLTKTFGLSPLTGTQTLVQLLHQLQSLLPDVIFLYSRPSVVRTGLAGTMKIGSSQRYFQPARVNFYIYTLNSRDSSPIFGVSAVRVFMLLFSFSIFSDRRSLKIENEKNSMKHINSET